MSLAVRTPVARSNPNPMNATAVESIPHTAATAHTATIPTNTADTICSCLVKLPSAASAFRAAAGASGVAVTSGPITL